MKHVINVIRFLIFLVLSIVLLWGMYWSLGKLIFWVFQLKLVWIILILVFAMSLLLGLGVVVFGFLGGALSYINPYKKIGGWIIIPLAIIFAILNIFFVWSYLELTYTKNIVIALISSALIIYCTIAFCATISAKNPKEYLGE